MEKRRGIGPAVTEYANLEVQLRIGVNRRVQPIRLTGDPICVSSTTPATTAEYSTTD